MPQKPKAKWAHDWEVDLGDGQVQVYQGHPRYCQIWDEHTAHMFRFEYRLRDGALVKGSYLCIGEAKEPFPLRYMDSL